MYEAHFGLKENPFSLLPDPSFLYLGEVHSMGQTLLEYGLINNVGISVITGDIGSGKTTLVRHLLEQLDDEVTVGLISNTHPSFERLFEWVLLSFGLDYKNKTRVELYESFVEYLVAEYARGQRTILIVDEAQNMGADSLEDLRLLSNINADKDQLFQLILVGQPGLRHTLKVPELVQFAHRVGVDYHLGPLSTAETRAYVSHRLRVAGGAPDLFTDEACRAVHEASGGIPRLINLLCDTALVYAYGNLEPRVDAPVVEEVVRDKRRGGLLDFGHRPDVPQPARAGSADARAVPLRDARVNEAGAFEQRARARPRADDSARAPARVHDALAPVPAPGPREEGDELEMEELRELFGSLRKD